MLNFILGYSLCEWFPSLNVFEIFLGADSLDDALNYFQQSNYFIIKFIALFLIQLRTVMNVTYIMYSNLKVI